jgi:glycerol-3-phosphate dehydrogenase
VKRDLAALVAREHDVVVVGGGIHGAAVAWDAAQRGLAVALVEAADFGGGASWNSLKTVHGGLRHLQRADVAGLRESARERATLVRIAPGLVRPLPFVVPTFRGASPSRLALAAALRLNRALALGTGGRGAGAFAARSLSPREVLARVPGLDAARLTGGAEWTDGQVESTERLLMGFLHAAAEHGAALANSVEVTGFEHEGRRVRAVVARDVEAGEALRLRARLVINAAGPARDAVLAGGGVGRRTTPLLHAMNLVLGSPATATHAVGARSGGRFLFLVPWRGHAIVGTAYDAAAPPDVSGFLAEARDAFPWAGLRADDVTLVHRGKVPGTGQGPALVTRSRVVDHEKEDGVAGVLSILSAKYTTARATAEAAVDVALRRLPGRFARCRTAETPLRRAAPLQGTLGDRAREAAREEAARHLDDAVLRRLDLATAGRPSPAAVDEVAAAMAAELGWNEARLAGERARLEAALRAAEAR